MNKEGNRAVFVSRDPYAPTGLVHLGNVLAFWKPHDACPFGPLAQMRAAWADEFEHGYEAAATGRIDPGLARAGIALLREQPQTADGQVLLATDLHADNILAARREPWLIIDPKPYAGDPACDLLPHMLNGEDRAGRWPSRAGRPDGGAGRD